MNTFFRLTWLHTHGTLLLIPNQHFVMFVERLYQASTNYQSWNCWSTSKYKIELDIWKAIDFGCFLVWSNLKYNVFQEWRPLDTVAEFVRSKPTNLAFQTSSLDASGTLWTALKKSHTLLKMWVVFAIMIPSIFDHQFLFLWHFQKKFPNHLAIHYAMKYLAHFLTYCLLDFLVY